jgi:5-methyltetrahydrofolate--homocysteine methyltransferase
MLKKLLKTKILVLDGAMGTSLQNFNLSPEDFGGEQYDGCNENLVLTNPEIITRVHESYLEAGADIIETNTFGGTPVVLEEYQLQNKFYSFHMRGYETNVTIIHHEFI